MNPHRRTVATLSLAVGLLQYIVMAFPSQSPDPLNQWLMASDFSNGLSITIS